MNALQRESDTFRTQLTTKAREVVVSAPNNNHELVELRRLNANLNSELALRDNELNRLRNH